MNSEFFDFPVDGTLDLHMFRPNEVKSVLEEYLMQCRMRGILHVRVIHGKGHGVLCRIVHSFLERCSHVAEYGIAQDGSSWGATLVVLHPLGSESPGDAE